MLLAEAADEQILTSFLDLIYEDQTGIAHVATLTSKEKGDFQQYFFEWPKQRAEMQALILQERARKEVWYGPAILNGRASTKESVKSSRVVWCEFDGELPADLQGLPEPSLRVQSSTEGRQHWYWRVAESLSAADLERINRSLAYGLGADYSGWDASQILRPPGTFNHKRQRTVQALTFGSETVSLSAFDGLPDPPPVRTIPVPSSIPEVLGVITKYPFNDRVASLFREGPAEDDRSNGLMSLGYFLAEMQMADDEMFSVLLNADQRWGKFHGRADQHTRLMEIVNIAKTRYPHTKQAEAVETRLMFLSYSELMATEEHVEWLLEGLLQKKGYMLLTGPSQVGKSTLALQAAVQLALGYEFRNDFIGRTVGEPQKVGFFSLEMNLGELKYFLDHQLKGWGLNKEQLAELDENFKLLPLGEPIYLTDNSQRERVEEVVERENFKGVFFDSLGSTTDKSVSDEETAKKLMDWNDHLRNSAEVFTWFIHHHRKASGNNKKPNSLADVYGNQYITARSTTTACLWPTLTPNTIQFLPLKVRLSPNKEPFNIVRDDNLIFSASQYSVAGPLDVEDSPVIVDDEGPEPDVGAF